VANREGMGDKTGPRGPAEPVALDNRARRARTDRGVGFPVPSRYLSAGHIRHAYALTGHAGQGVTVDRAFVLGSSEARLQEWGYVALSRARDATRLYVTATVVERETHAPEADERSPLTRFAQALEESSIERLALDQRPLPTGPKHETRPEIHRPIPAGDLRAQLRLLEHERVAVARARAEAERKLQQAEQQGAQLGFLA